mgnify:CR=1 FL=1
MDGGSPAKSKKPAESTTLCTECYQHVLVGQVNCQNCGAVLLNKDDGTSRGDPSPKSSKSESYTKSKTSKKVNSPDENFYWNKVRSRYSEMTSDLSRGERGVVAGSIVLFAIAIPLWLYSEFTNWPQNTDSSPAPSGESSNYEPVDNLSLSLSSSNIVCDTGWCTIFRGEYTNRGNTPVNVFEEMCLVAGGKTYSEKFGEYLSETIDPGQTLLFEASFDFAAGATATEFFIGNCSSNTKVASARITG